MASNWDQRKFDVALNACLANTGRTAANVINGHALAIAFGAQRNTPKADKISIGKSLSELIYDFKTTKKGASRRLKMRTVFTGAGGATALAPIVALLINKARGAKGQPGLYGSEMAAAIRKLIAKRQSTVAFLKSGWTPAIKQLLPLVPSKYRTKSGYIEKVMGEPKGGVFPATPEQNSPTCRIFNAIGTAGTNSASHNAALERYGRPALEMAFETETASMVEHLRQKLSEEAFAEFNRMAA
jgi:hypothetical protein